jgi:hypothetical protein
MDMSRRLGCRIGALAAAALLAGEARSQGGDPVVITCDPAGPRLTIGSGEPPSDAPSGLEVTAVDWSRLIRFGSEKNPAGDPLRSGSRTVEHRCGPLLVSVRGGFLNANAVGELGAVEFGVIAVRRGDRAVVPATALEECEQGNPRFLAHGDCPDRWAESIRVAPSPGGWRVAYERVYLDEDLASRRATDEETVRDGGYHPAATRPGVKR